MSVKLYPFFNIGHEITHAFDNVGILYDTTRSYRTLYDDETISRFHEASRKDMQMWYQTHML